MVIDVRWGSATHQGRVRDRNEDAVLAGPDVFAVADGMGGHAGGEVASALAVAGLAELRGLQDAVDPASLVVDELARLNHEIRRRAHQDGWAGMGTTVAGLARIEGPRALVFNLGDSRVYLLRGGVLTQLTEDHSVVGDLVRSGELTEDEARRHPHRNVVTRALGVEPTVDVAVSTVRVEVGDCFLVASDGLFNEVPPGQISDVLSTPGPVERRARDLLDAALFRGARDNVSVVVVAVAGTQAVDGLEVDTAPSVPRPADPGIRAEADPAGMAPPTLDRDGPGASRRPHPAPS